MRSLVLVTLVVAAGCGGDGRTVSDLYCGGYGGHPCPSGFDCKSSGECCDQLSPCEPSGGNTCHADADCLPGYLCEVSASPPFCRPATLCDDYGSLDAAPVCPDGQYCKTWQPSDQSFISLYQGYCVSLAVDVGTLACQGSTGWCPVPFTCLSGRCHLACTGEGECPSGLTCQALGDDSLACLAQ